MLRDSFVDVVISHYRLLEKIGEGGQAVVHRALDRNTGVAEVAIKVLKAALADDRDRRERLMREAQIQASIPHPNLVKVFTCDKTPDGLHYIVMELLHGEPLSKRLLRGRLPTAGAVRVALDVVSAVIALAERGLVHRDIKASNVFLATVSPDAASVTKLMDLGVAYDPRERLTESGVFVGTRGSASPEQLDPEMNRSVGPKSDVYQICLLLYQMLAGKLLFEPDASVDRLRFLHKSDYRPELDALAQHVSPSLVEHLRKGIRYDPDERPELHEFAAELRREMDRQRRPISGLAFQVVARVLTKAQRSRGAAIASAVAVAAAIAGSILYGSGRAAKKEPLAVAAVARAHEPVSADADARQEQPRQQVLAALQRAKSQLADLAGEEFWMGRSDAEIRRQIAEMKRTRPKKYFESTAPKLWRQVHKRVYQPPVNVEKTEVSRQQGVLFLNSQSGIQEVAEKHGELTYRYIVDAHGVKLFDNVVIKGQSECVFTKGADGQWATTPECALMPLDKVTPAGAKAYCGSIGRHLITAQEWERAARDETDNTWPWGNKNPDCKLHSFDQMRFDPTSKYAPDAPPECPTGNPQARSVRDDTSDVTKEGVKFLFGNDAEITSTPFLDPDQPNDKFVEVRGSSVLSTRELGMTSWRSRMPADVARAQTSFRCAE